MLDDEGFYLCLFARLETLPVFRHGSEAARICDEALSVSGPTDPRIAKIVQSDQNAQMAYHIHKALGFALEVESECCCVIIL